MKRVAFVFALAAVAALAQIRIDTGEAEAVLGIAAGHDATPLWLSEGYTRLKKRDAEFGRALTDDDFRKFAESNDVKHQAADLTAALEQWKQADLVAITAKVRAYLPADAKIRATVYIVIKPRSNSFVYDLKTNPAIFLRLDPSKTKAQFENTVAHELHHVGFASIPQVNKSSWTDQQREAVEWISGFGEGLAMLAAAGSPDVNPQATSSPEDLARWDHDMANFPRDMKSVQQFLLDVLSGKLDKAHQQTEGMAFFGVQGPWYTVGYKMAVVIEKAKGRDALIDCMYDVRKLLFVYNVVAKEEQLPQWSNELLEHLI
jgi:hypothetical protein